MPDSDGFSCKKFVSFDSDLGMTLYWLKSRFSEQLDDPITSAVCNVYLPSVLATSSETIDKTRIPSVYQQCFSSFERWMNLAQSNEALADPGIKRFRVNLQLSFEGSDAQKTLDWLCKRDAGSLERRIFEATQLMFLPIALSTFKRHRLPHEIEKARLIFSRRMDVGSIAFQLPPSGKSKDEEHVDEHNSPSQSNQDFISQSHESPAMKSTVKQAMASSAPVEEQNAMQNGRVHKKPEIPPKLNLDFDF